MLRNGNFFDLDEILRHDELCSTFDCHSRFPASEKKSMNGHPPNQVLHSLLFCQLCLEFGKFLLRVTSDDSLDRLCVLLELHAEGLGHKLDIELLVDVGFGQVLLDHKLLLGSVRVDSQVVRASVSTADTFDPSVRRLDLEIPTVLQIRMLQLVQAIFWL